MAFDTLAGAKAGGQIAWPERRIRGDRPNKMTTGNATIACVAVPAAKTAKRKI
ncbi:hypothetical protein [Methylocystis iwaonis]|uniref:hypothetical protein n=1 Tax=Methylocystis iwaonis TaxID=2885079 RepID=UPI002E7C3A84|nr:hypothetical protein [Methylocystis iwaonis]